MGNRGHAEGGREGGRAGGMEGGRGRGRQVWMGEASKCIYTEIHLNINIHTMGEASKWKITQKYI